MAIIAASDYKSYAGITVTTYDARLALLIPQLQAKVESYCRRLFDYSASYTEKIDGDGTDCLTLKRAPISTVASLTAVYDSSTTATYASTDYTFSTDDDGRLWLYGSSYGRTGLDSWGLPRSQSVAYSPRFPVGRANITVVYAGGYGTPGPAMPPELQLAFMETLSEVMVLSTAAGGGSTAGAAAGVLKSKTLGRNSEEYRDVEQAFAKFQERFNPFRRIVLG